MKNDYIEYKFTFYIIKLYNITTRSQGFRLLWLGEINVFRSLYIDLFSNIISH